MPGHNSLEHLGSSLQNVAQQYPVGSVLFPRESHEPDRYVCTFAIDEESEMPGVVYQVADVPGTLRFCPADLLDTFATQASRSLLPPTPLITRRVHDGTFWRHTKTGGLYRVIQKAFSDVSGLEGVLYYPRSNERVRFFRSLLNFTGSVAMHSVELPRFSEVSFTEFDDLRAHD